MLRVNRMAGEERVPSPSLIPYVTRPKTVQSTFFFGRLEIKRDGVRSGRSIGKVIQWKTHTNSWYLNKGRPTRPS